MGVAHGDGTWTGTTDGTWDGTWTGTTGLSSLDSLANVLAHGQALLLAGDGTCGTWTGTTGLSSLDSLANVLPSTWFRPVGILTRSDSLSVV
jgi:hypothetical protein